jgi:hypothetical protein
MYNVLSKNKSHFWTDLLQMDDEELYILDDVLEEANAARYQMLPKNIKITLSSERIGKIYE